MAAEGSGVARIGSDPDERSDLAAAQVAEFGEVDEQRAGDRRADARNGLQELKELRLLCVLEQRDVECIPSAEVGHSDGLS